MNTNETILSFALIPSYVYIQKTYRKMTTTEERSQGLGWITSFISISFP